MLAVIGRALVVVAGYIGNVPLMLVFTAVAALGQGPWQGDMNAPFLTPPLRCFIK